MLARCRVVLVRPTIASNIGAAARVMRNMGLSDLVLVDPAADPSDRYAELTATRHGLPILERLRVVGDLGEAVGGCLRVAATSSRVVGPFRRQASGTPEEVLPGLLDVLADGPAALVFGPEPSGLTDAEVARCHRLVHIPADPGYPALNLAQAVAVCLYVLRSAWLRREQPPPAPDGPAPFADQERMFDHLRQGLEAIHFLYGPKADALMHGLRHLIGRASPTPMEIRLLHGLARQMLWQARREPGDAPAADDPSPGR